MTTQPVETPLNVRIINPLEIADWDERVAKLPGATFFHSVAWARVLHETYGYAPIYFVGEQAQQLVCILPMMEVNSWLTGRRGVSLPFTDECQPLAPDVPTFRKLFEAARQHGNARSWKYIELRGGRQLIPDSIASTQFFDHELKLEPDSEVMFRQFSDSVRRAVRKAEKSELSLEFSRDLKAVQSFHSLLCLTRKRHGVPPQPFDFFEQIHRHVLTPGKGWVVLARYKGRPVAGGVFFHFNQSALYKFGASDEAVQNLRANNLVMAKAIDWHARNKFASFSFGRTSVYNQGLRAFKLGWGTTERQIEYVRLAPRTGTFLTAPDRANGISQRIFNRLPLGISRLIGTALYQHVA